MLAGPNKKKEEEEVKMKINTLRSNFQRELAKI
jgi:hypothetical protein